MSDGDLYSRINEAVSENLYLKRTNERIERVIHQRDETLLKIIEVIKGLNRENRK
jgi:hypothetical protein